MVMLARWAHARVIAVDIFAEKLVKCRELGAEAVVDASKENVVEVLRDLTKGVGVDVAIDFVSHVSTLEAAVESLGKGGRLVTLGGVFTPTFSRLSLPSARRGIRDYGEPCLYQAGDH